MKTIDLSWLDLGLMYSLLVIPLALMIWLRVGEIRDILVAVVRMTVQLWLVGLYLKVIFDFNALWLNTLWILAMLTVANTSMLKQARLVYRRFFVVTFLGTAAAIVGVAVFFVVAVIRPQPVYDARYLIPIVGMVLGNCMRGNVLSLERFYAGIRDRETEFITYQMLGATLMEATRPYMREALRAAMGPLVATMATTGIVSLPGMMTGQILGGSFPLTAIKYQLAIIVCIFSAMVIASICNLLFSLKIGFDEYGMLRQEIFAGQAGSSG